MDEKLLAIYMTGKVLLQLSFLQPLQINRVDHFNRKISKYYEQPKKNKMTYK